jgi:NitT/TauT family transport system substrate-binding protein
MSMHRRPYIAAQHWRGVFTKFAVVLILFAACAFASGHAAAEDLKVGFVRTPGYGPLYVAQERGYFAAEGVPVALVYFDSAQPVTVAVVAGSIDFGVGNPTGAFYNLAGQGELRVIAGATREAPGFQYFAYLVSTRAYEAGLKSPHGFAGHSAAITLVGNPPHYMLGLLAEKYRFDLTSIRLLPVQSLANTIAAIVGGQADATVQVMVPAVPPLIQKGDIRVLGWVGDETPWQINAVFAATKTADQRKDTVVRFLRAYRRGVRDYHDAFTGQGETRQDGPTAPEIVAIVAKYTGLTIDDVKLGVPYFDADARLDVKDVLHQIAWYKSQGMVKPEIDADQIIDKRYVIPLPEH